MRSVRLPVRRVPCLRVQCERTGTGKPRPSLSDDELAERRQARQELEGLADVYAAVQHVDHILDGVAQGLPRPSQLLEAVTARIASLEAKVLGHNVGRQRPKQRWNRWDADRPRALVAIDETGLSKGNDPEAPYFGVAAVLIRKEDLPVVESAIEAWKIKHFGRARYIHELQIRKGTGAFYFDGDASRRTRAREELFVLLRDLPYAVTAVVIDKERFSKEHPDGRIDTVLPTRLYPMVVNMLFERVVHWLWVSGDRKGDIEAEGIGEKEDAYLQQAVSNLKLRGTRFQDEMWFRYQLADHVSFHGKPDAMAGLQLADWVVKACADAARAARDPSVRKDDRVAHAMWDAIKGHAYDGRQRRADTFGIKVYPGLDDAQRAWLFPDCDPTSLAMWEPEKLKGLEE